MQERTSSTARDAAGERRELLQHGQVDAVHRACVSVRCGIIAKQARRVAGAQREQGQQHKRAAWQAQVCELA